MEDPQRIERMESTERMVIEAALKGDPEAFEMIIRTYSRTLFAHAYSILRQPEEAEDVVQESLLKAYRSRWRVRSPEKFPQWLVSITRNRALDCRRRHRTVSLPENQAELVDPRAEKPDRQLEQTEIRDQIHGALSSTSSTPPTDTVGVPDQRKLIRNARLELEVEAFESVFQQIVQIVTEEKGFVATTTSTRLPTGKIRGEVVVKVLPGNLERVLLRLKALGEVRNQSIAMQDVTRDYFETDARLRNARRMEERLLAMLDKTSGKVTDLLTVEKEVGRVREEIEQLQGSLKVYDSLVQYATIVLALSEKDLDQPAESPVQQTHLLMLARNVEEQVKSIKQAASRMGARICSSTFNRSAEGDELAEMTLRIPMGKYDELVQVIKGTGKLKQSTIQRIDRVGKHPEEGCAEIAIRLYSRGAIVDIMRAGTGFFETLRTTALQGFEALFWSLQQIGIGLAFVAPWAIVIGPIAWLIARRRNRSRKDLTQ